MSLSFRPVKEVWGEPTDQFVSYIAVVELIHKAAEEIGETAIQNTYGYLEVIWIADGRPFLRFLQNEDKFNILRYREFFPDEDEAGLQSLISNIRNMAEKWKESLDEDGSLRFYID